MGKRIRNVWARACPKCLAQVNVPCRDLRTQSGTLFGRRTHPERAREVKLHPESQEPPRINATYRWPVPVEPTQLWTQVEGIQVTPNYTVATGSTWTTATAIDVWKTWQRMNATATTATYQMDRVWRDWQRYEYRVGARVLTDEDLVRRQAEMDQRARERESRRRLQLEQEKHLRELSVQAHDRSMELLRSILTGEQLIELERDHQVTVRSQKGQLYRVETHRKTVHGNIVLTDEHGCILERACVAPGMYVEGGALPTGDGWVGQVLALKFNEDALLAKANWSMRRPCQHPNVPILGRTAA